MQAKLFEAAEDLSAATTKRQAQRPVLRTKTEKNHPRRTSLSKHLGREEIHLELASTGCGCGQAMQRISKDVSEGVDFVPGTLLVEHHIRLVRVSRCFDCMRQHSTLECIVDSDITTEALLSVYRYRELDRLMVQLLDVLAHLNGTATRSYYAQITKIVSKIKSLRGGTSGEPIDLTDTSNVS